MALKGRVDRHDERLDYLQGNIVDNSTRISIVEDGVKANAKDINVVGTIAMENRQFIGDNKVAIANNTKNININAKAIDELKGQVGQSSTVINDIKKQITNINGKVENNTTNIANNTTNIAKNTTAINNVNVKVDANAKAIIDK